MHAAAEADMARRLARDVVAIGIRPAPGIAVGGAEEHQHLLALADPAATDLDIFCLGAEEGLCRACEADRFLERIARQRWIAAQPRKFFREARQTIDGSANAVDRGVDPGRE